MTPLRQYIFLSRFPRYLVINYQNIICWLSYISNKLNIMADELFQEVLEKDMPKVLNALKQDWPEHFLLHQTLTILEEYKKAGTTWKHTLYLYGDYETGVYLNKLFIGSGSQTFLYVYTPNSDLTELKNALKQTQTVPWETGNFKFQMTHHRFLNVIEEVFASKCKTCGVSSDTLFWFPPQKELLKLELPEDIYVDFLDGSYAEQMDKDWPHRYPGSELVHKEHLEKHFGLGLFRKSDKRLLASALCNHTGGIFVLNSDAEFRGRGYATMLVQHMTQEIRQRGLIPFCRVIIGNKPSERVFIKAGFEPFTNTDYIFPRN